MTDMTDVKTSPSFYLVLELYNNPTDYSSADGKIPVIRAVSEDIHGAAEVVATKKITELQYFVDQFGQGKKIKPFAQNLFVIKVPGGTYVDAMNFPRIAVTEAHLSEETKKSLQSVMTSYNQVHSTTMKLNDTTGSSLNANINLRVDPSTYEKDRRAKELEMMKRWNVQSSSTKKSVTGTIPPQPAKPIVVRPALRSNINPHSSTLSTQTQTLKMADNAELNAPAAGTVTNTPNAPNATTVIPTFTAPPTPTTSAPSPLPGLLPIASEVPNPVSTSVPLAPVTAGSSINNPVGTGGASSVGNIVVNSAGEVYSGAANGTATAATSRVTGTF